MKILITGVAGFIGSNLLEHCLKEGHEVIGIDNFSTGHIHNVKPFWDDFFLIDGDIVEWDTDIVFKSSHLDGIDVILHQAALGSIPRSLADPLTTHNNNLTGFLNVLNFAKEKMIPRVVYASSSSVYGDEPNLPKIEERIGKQLSPYAVTKYANELYADVFSKCYDMDIIGLRYFNVFGRRQDPNGAYAAVIPKWIKQIMNGETVTINGDGLTSRDFCYIDNVIQANMKAAITDYNGHRAFNIACGHSINLAELFNTIFKLVQWHCGASKTTCVYGPERPGDVKHSLADISLAEELLGYTPQYNVWDGLDLTVQWYRNSYLL